MPRKNFKINYNGKGENKMKRTIKAISTEFVNECKTILAENESLKMKLAARESLIEALANEFMEVVEDGKFKYINEKLSNRVNEIY
jgi:uncharacterized protein YqgV (UPF0045/DUF77 family)